MTPVTGAKERGLLRACFQPYIDLTSNDKLGTIVPYYLTLQDLDNLIVLKWPIIIWDAVTRIASLHGNSEDDCSMLITSSLRDSCFMLLQGIILRFGSMRMTA